ncbi:hypothetical protein BX73_00145 [Escherichia coli O111:NM str. 2010C-4735]|nr:hypothetical protein BX73_00145 [Escherichia coli O111:NM str. 2010C-4735]
MQWRQQMLFLMRITLSWRSHRNFSKCFCPLTPTRSTHSLLIARKWTWQKSVWLMRCVRNWQPILSCWL